MRARILSIASLLVLVLALVPLSSAADAGKGKWTVLVYLDADNNLEGSGMYNMRELESIPQVPGVRVLVQMDRIPGYDASDGDWTGAHRYEIAQGSGDPDKLASPVVQDLGEVDMADPATLQDFLVWGVQRAPADHYYVVLWDHGAAWEGVHEDATSGTFMSLAQLGQALSGAESASGVAKWDVIDFDACLMGSSDVTHAMQPHAKIVVGSEELVPGLGLPYPTLLRTLTANPDIDAPTLAEGLLPAYAARYDAQAGSPDPDAVLSVYDEGGEPAFWTALDAMNGAIATQASASWPQIVTSARASEHFKKPDEKNSEAVDVVGFALNLENATVDASLKSAAHGVVAASPGFILGATTSPGHPHARGVTMRFGVPDAGESSASGSGPSDSSGAAAEARNAVARAARSDERAPDITAFETSGPATISPGSALAFRATAADAHLLSVDGAVTKVEGDAEFVLQYIPPAKIDFADDGANATATFSWNGRVTTLTNGASSLVAPAYQTGDDGGWTLDGSYKPASGDAFNASLDFDANGKLQHAWDVSGAASEITPAAGDSFAPVYLAVSGADDADKLGQYVPAKGAGVDAWRLDLGQLAPGQYQLSVYADDLAGNANLSEPQTLTVLAAARASPEASPSAAPPASATNAPSEPSPAKSPGPGALLTGVAALGVALALRRR